MSVHKPALVVLDPLQAFLDGKVDMNRPNQTRTALSPLAEIAERYGCAVLVIRHLAKKDYRNPLYRGFTSIDITAVARSIIQVVADPRSEDHMIMTHIKYNVTDRGESIYYTTKEGNFRWLEFSKITAKDLIELSESKKPRQTAKDFLAEELFFAPKPATASSKKRLGGGSQRRL